MNDVDKITSCPTLRLPIVLPSLILKIYICCVTGWNRTPRVHVPFRITYVYAICDHRIACARSRKLYLRSLSYCTCTTLVQLSWLRYFQGDKHCHYVFLVERSDAKYSESTKRRRV